MVTNASRTLYSGDMYHNISLLIRSPLPRPSPDAQSRHQGRFQVCMFSLALLCPDHHEDNDTLF